MKLALSLAATACGGAGNAAPSGLAISRTLDCVRLTDHTIALGVADQNESGRARAIDDCSIAFHTGHPGPEDWRIYDCVIAAGDHQTAEACRTTPASDTLTKDQIREGIRPLIPKLQACYQRLQATSPAIDGTVTALFTIAPDGSVSASSAEGLDPQIAICIADAVKTASFARASGPTTASYPFIFHP